MNHIETLKKKLMRKQEWRDVSREVVKQEERAIAKHPECAAEWQMYLDRAKSALEQRDAEVAALEWAIAVCEAAMRVQNDTATDSLGDTPQPANRWYTVGPGAMERLFAALEGKEANSGGDNT